MIGKANSDVTPTFAGGLQKPQGSTRAVFWSYLTHHTQGCGKERLVRFHAMRSTYASRVRHLKKSCYPKSRLTSQLKSCYPGAFMTIGIGWSSIVKQWAKQNKGGRLLVLALIRYYTWGTTLPGLDQREPAEAVLALLGITPSTWHTTLHYRKSCKSLLPKWFQDIA